MASNPIFHDDIMVEILVKLPVQSILRCNALSKHYYSLIHSQHFIRRHLNLGRLNNKPYNQSIVSSKLGSLHLFDRRGHFKQLEGLPIIVKESFSIDKQMLCGPVDGLYFIIGPGRDRFAVWNPFTRETFNLPTASQLRWDFIDTWDCGIAFDELDCYCHKCLGCGIGYDDTSNDYKLVLIYGFLACTDCDDDTVRNSTFFTMNIGKGEWRTPEKEVSFDAWGIKTSVGVITCGAWHWAYECVYDSCYKILAFDILIESQNYVSFPMVRDGYEWFDMSIVSFNGCLGLVHAQRGVDMKELSSSFDVWVMEEYGVTDSWKILFHVSLADGLGGRFLGIVKDRFYISEGEGWIVSYDIVSKDEERYGILDGEVRSLLPYEESLVRIVKSN